MRNITVPVDVVLSDSVPDDSHQEWDHVVDCSPQVETGRMVIAGCTDYIPDAARLDVAAGTYRARIYFSGLDMLSDDGLEGNDLYEIRLWPGPSIDPTVVKAYGSAEGERRR